MHRYKNAVCIAALFLELMERNSNEAAVQLQTTKYIRAQQHRPNMYSSINKIAETKEASNCT